MRSIGGCVLEQWTRQMGTQHNTRHILHIAQKGSSPHDMSCPSKRAPPSATLESYLNALNVMAKEL